MCSRITNIILLYRKSLLSVLIQLLLPHSLERIQSITFLEQIEPMIERVMPQLTIVSFRSVPNEAIPFIIVNELLGCYR